MKRFKKELVLLAIVLAVATMGLMQLFHEEAYAVAGCSSCGNCGGPCVLDTVCDEEGFCYTIWGTCRCNQNCPC
jgi:hypothetical protein